MGRGARSAFCIRIAVLPLMAAGYEKEYQRFTGEGNGSVHRGVIFL